MGWQEPGPFPSHPGKVMGCLTGTGQRRGADVVAPGVWPAPSSWLCRARRHPKPAHLYNEPECNFKRCFLLMFRCYLGWGAAYSYVGLPVDERLSHSDLLQGLLSATGRENVHGRKATVSKPHHTVGMCRLLSCTADFSGKELPRDKEKCLRYFRQNT